MIPPRLARPSKSRGEEQRVMMVGSLFSTLAGGFRIVSLKTINSNYRENVHGYEQYIQYFKRDYWFNIIIIYEA